jgi:hypothetical protein
VSPIIPLIIRDNPREIAHPLERNALARGDLGDGYARVQEIDDPPLAVGVALAGLAVFASPRGARVARYFPSLEAGPFGGFQSEPSKREG